MRAPLFDEKERIFNYLDMNGENCHSCGTVQCGAAAFDWAVKNVLGGDGGSQDISRVENMARQIRPGSEGVLFLPTLMGLAHALLGREHARLPHGLYAVPRPKAHRPRSL